MIRKIFYFFVSIAFMILLFFLGGSAFLLYALVPFEAWVSRNVPWQQEVDFILLLSIYGWVLFCISATIIFHFFTLGKVKRTGVALLLIIVLTAASSLAYRDLSTSNLAMIIDSRAEVMDKNQRIVFGPYPDQEMLSELETSGFNGVITLLSYAIPFENQLLAQEKKHGEEVGITIHSFPMLPWVLANEDALREIDNLISNNPGQRYYIHCYLGKHRVNLVRKKLGEYIQISDSLSLPDSFERGQLYTIREQDIVLGPYPTPEEWLELNAQGITSVISTFDKEAAARWLEQEREICATLNIRLWHLDVKGAINKEELKAIKEYVSTDDGRTYIHGFRADDTIAKLYKLLDK